VSSRVFQGRHARHASCQLWHVSADATRTTARAGMATQAKCLNAAAHLHRSLPPQCGVMADLKAWGQGQDAGMLPLS